jgi:DNA polymerase III alpha subunit
LFDLLYQDPTIDFDRFHLKAGHDSVEIAKFNTSVKQLYADFPPLKTLRGELGSVEEFHERQQSNWHMPEEYKNLDIAQWVLAQCKTQEELQRVGEELLLYQERDLFNLLRYLKYAVDMFRKNNVVWGLGRGSSVASYVLYLIGVHKINSMYYDLDIKEFLR